MYFADSRNHSGWHSNENSLRKLTLQALYLGRLWRIYHWLFRCYSSAEALSVTGAKLSARERTTNGGPPLAAGDAHVVP
jgi:hypothetical protein